MKPEGILSKFLSRNYHMAVGVLIVSAVGLFQHLLTGGEWVAVSTGVITAFRAGDALVNYLQTRPLTPPPGAPNV